MNQAPSFDGRRDKAATLAAAHRQLRDELIDAISSDPTKLVETPGFNDFAMPAQAVLEDLMAGVGSEANWLELTRILGRVASGKLDPLTHLRASALLAKLAKQHADFHADDLAETLLDEAVA